MMYTLPLIFVSLKPIRTHTDVVSLLDHLTYTPCIPNPLLYPYRAAAVFT